MAPVLPVTIRLAREADLPQLGRLAERDSRPLPDGQLLIAERDGAIQAALSPESGRAIADPFAPTADLVGLLRAHAAARRSRLRTFPRRPRITPRLGVGSLWGGAMRRRAAPPLRRLL
jgi:hypothetical protein